MYLYLLNRKNIDLSVAEVLSIAKNKDHEIIESYLLLDELVDYKRLAFTKSVYQLLFEADEENLKTSLESFEFNTIYETSFRLKLINNEKFKLEILADIIWNNLKNPRADMKDAKTKIDIIFSKKIFCCLLIGEIKDAFEERRAHLRPYNHPTSLHPRLARCLVNLVNEKEIFDPFCGSGGILIEAGLSNLRIIGFDLDLKMLDMCRENLDHFRIKNYILEQKDATKIDQKFKAVVTDLPYGKSSKVTNLEKTYEEFLTNARKHVDKMVVVFPEYEKFKKMIIDSGWKIIQRYSYYIHKSLTKEIIVLRKNI